MTSGDESDSSAVISRARNFLDHPATQGLWGGIATLLGPFGAPLAAAQTSWTAWRANTELGRVRVYIEQLVERLLAVEAREPNFRSIFEQPEAQEWVSDTIDRARQTRGREKLAILASMAAGSMTSNWSDGARNLAEQLWDVAASLSYDEIRLLGVLWREAGHSSHRGVFVSLATLADRCTISLSLAEAYVARLIGMGFLAEATAIEIAPGIVRDKSEVTPAFTRDQYRPTVLCESLFRLLRDGGFEEIE